MKASLLSTALQTLIRIRRPVFVWGPPAVGKSMVVKQTTDIVFPTTPTSSPNMIDVRAILLDPVDLRGLPSVNGDGRAHWCQPDFLPRDGEGVLFLDELNSAPRSTQAACYQLMLDRALGEYRLPDGWSIVCAGNRETDRAVVERMPSALASRLVHLDFEVDVNDWTKWAIGAGLATEVIAFIRFRPELLHAFDPTKRSFPAPRTWQFVAEILAAKPNPAIEYDLLAGTVGEGAAAEMAGFLRVWRTLPSPDAVIMNPDKAKVPTDPATLYALAGALARKAEAGNFDRVIRYSTRMGAEFSVLTVKMAIGRDDQLTSTRAFIEWAAMNADVLI